MSQKKYHVALSRPFDLEQFDLEAQEGKCPRHAMSLLRNELGADLYQPPVDNSQCSLRDSFNAILSGASQPIHWKLGRDLALQLDEEDVIFSIGEDSGFPLAASFDCSVSRAKNVVFVHNPDRFRARFTMKWFRLRDRVDLFVTNTEEKGRMLQDYLNLPEERVYVVQEQTDTQFFTPGPASADKKRPLIGSGGLEQRDYITLASAAGDLDLDIKICAVSPNARAMKDTFPDVMPDNMSIHRYSWRELRQHYRDSDVVVITLKDHNYQAGLTTLFESLACKRPVIMTLTPGVAADFVAHGLITGVPPADPAAMRAAILEVIENPQQAAEQAERGYERVIREHGVEHYVHALVERIRGCAN